MVEEMMSILILATIFGGIGWILGVIFWGVRSIRGGGGVSRKQQENETRMLQEMYKALTRMEERIESLETILFEKQKNEQTGKDVKDA